MKHKILAAIIIALALALMILFMGDSEPGPTGGKNTAGNTAMTESGDVFRDADSGNEVMNHSRGQPAHGLETSLRFLAQSALKGDARSPNVAASSRLEPGAPNDALLADPAAYERTQVEARAAVAGNFRRAARQRLTDMRARISKANELGNRSEKEMKQAMEAVRELEKARNLLRGSKDGS